MDEPRQRLLEMESTSCEDAVKLVEMTTKDLEYSPNPVDKAALGFERADCNSERSSTVGKMLPNSILRCRRIFLRVRSTDRAKVIFVLFQKLPQPLQLPAATLVREQPPTSRPTLHQQEDNNSQKAQRMISVFSNKVFLN